MKWLGWAVAIIAFLAMLYTCALPGDLAVGRDDEAGLAGVYTVNGVDPAGDGYSGTMIITTTDDPSRFDIEWIITGSIQRGVGVRAGDELVVEWTAVASAVGSGTGRSVYVIEPDGRLVGTWQVDGSDEQGTEEVFPEP